MRRAREGAALVHAQRLLLQPDAPPVERVQRVAVDELRHAAFHLGIHDVTAAPDRPASVPPESPGRRARAAPLVMLHGLFGDADNLRGLGARLGDGSGGGGAREVLRLDLPGHGGRAATDPLDQPGLARAIAADVAGAFDVPVHLLGHSLGGKVAMALVGLDGAPPLASLTVLDIAPKPYPPHHDRIIAALAGLDLGAVGSRREADAALAAAIPTPGVRAFLLKGLARAPRDDGAADASGPRWRWRFDLERIARDYPHLSAAPPPAAPSPLPALFLYGGAGDYVDPAVDAAPILERFPDATLEAVAGAGHWLHAERPDAVAEACARFVERVDAARADGADPGGPGGPGGPGVP